MVTGNDYGATTGSVAELRQQLGMPFIAKPVTFDLLLDSVEEVAASMM